MKVEGNHEWHWSGSKEWDAGTVQGWHGVSPSAGRRRQGKFTMIVKHEYYSFRSTKKK